MIIFFLASSVIAQNFTILKFFKTLVITQNFTILLTSFFLFPAYMTELHKSLFHIIFILFYALTVYIEFLFINSSLTTQTQGSVAILE